MPVRSDIATPPCFMSSCPSQPGALIGGIPSTISYNKLTSSPISYQAALANPFSFWLRIVMSVDFLPPRRDREPDFGAWSPCPRVTPVLISLWSLMLASPASILATGAVWLWKGWEQGLNTLLVSTVILTLLFLHLSYLAGRDRRAMSRRKPKPQPRST